MKRAPVPRPGEVSLGDVIRATGRLAATGKGRGHTAIAGLLGFRSLGDRARLDRPSDGAEAPKAPHKPEGSKRVKPERRERHRRSETVTPLSVRALPPRDSAPGRPAWLSGDDRLDLKQTAAPAPLPSSLLVPVQRRAILTGALQRSMPSALPDLRRLLAEVAAGMPIARMPALQLPSLRGGVQVLTDLGESMTPYWLDQAALEDALRAVFLSERLELLQFRSHPQSGPVMDEAFASRAYRFPPRQTPVLVVSDFGLGPHHAAGERAGVGAWERFARQLRARGSRVVGLTPTSPKSWPRRLRRCIAMVPWDRSASVSVVGRAIAGSHA